MCLPKSKENTQEVLDNPTNAISFLGFTGPSLLVAQGSSMTSLTDNVSYTSNSMWKPLVQCISQETIHLHCPIQWVFTRCCCCCSRSTHSKLQLPYGAVLWIFKWKTHTHTSLILIMPWPAQWLGTSKAPHSQQTLPSGIPDLTSPKSVFYLCCPGSFWSPLVFAAQNAFGKPFWGPSSFSPTFQMIFLLQL